MTFNNININILLLYLKQHKISQGSYTKYISFVSAQSKAYDYHMYFNIFPKKVDY